MIQLDITPEIEQRLIEAADALGFEPAAYASKIVSDSVESAGRKPPSREEFAKFLEQMASHSDEMPQLPEYAYTRESFYEDHD